MYELLYKHATCSGVLQFPVNVYYVICLLHPFVFYFLRSYGTRPIFFLKNTYKSLQDLFSGSHYIETKKMASLFFLFSNILAREGVIIEQKSRKIA